MDCDPRQLRCSCHLRWFDRKGAVDRKAPMPNARDVAALAKRVAEFREKFANPYVAASRGHVDEVIQPRQTRAKLVSALARLETKRDKNPRVQSYPR